MKILLGARKVAKEQLLVDRERERERMSTPAMLCA